MFSCGLEYDYKGDGSSLFDAKFNGIGDIVMDSRYGKLYIADSGNHRIRVMDFNTWNISTIAGNGIAGFSGDGGNATLASLNTPERLALDFSSQILYIIDSKNYRVRAVNLVTQIITTVFGNGRNSTYMTFGYEAISTSTGVYMQSITIDEENKILYIAHLNNFSPRYFISATNL